MDFTDDITRGRPDISAGSKKTYNSLLRTIYKLTFPDDTTANTRKFIEYPHRVLEALKMKPLIQRKTYLAALISVAPLKEYRDVMMDGIEEYRVETQKREMSEKQAKSALSEDEIKNAEMSLRKNAEAIWSKQEITIKDLMDVQQYVIFSLFSGHIPPRRALDYVEMKYKNYTDRDNYMADGKFVFNKYKTAKYKGTQVIDIPESLQNILDKWVNMIPDMVDTLLFNSKMEPLTNVTLTQRLNSLFDAPKSVNSLRHHFLTQKYGAMMDKNDEMAKDMNDMGSSTAQAKVYVRKGSKAI